MQEIAAIAAWTNILGHVLFATPVALERSDVLFVQPSSRDGALVTNSFKLAVFPLHEQARIFDYLKLPQPISEEDAFRKAFVERNIEKISAMERDGLLSPSEAAERRSRLNRYLLHNTK